MIEQFDENSRSITGMLNSEMNKIGKEQGSPEEDEVREIDSLIDKMTDPLKF